MLLRQRDIEGVRPEGGVVKMMTMAMAMVVVEIRDELNELDWRVLSEWEKIFICGLICCCSTAVECLKIYHLANQPTNEHSRKLGLHLNLTLMWTVIPFFVLLVLYYTERVRWFLQWVSPCEESSVRILARQI